MDKRIPKTYGCAVELTLTVLNGKWKTIILSRLRERPLRYSELRAQIPRLSDKVLTQRLQDLKATGLVEAGDAPGQPYQLTERARSLEPVLQALCDWGESSAEAFGAQFSIEPF